jgi:hypothetical protein
MAASRRTIRATLTEHLQPLRSELGKDAVFFGGTGVLIGLLHLSEFKVLGGGATAARFSDDLLDDYLSMTALTFQMFGCMFVGGLIGLLGSLSPLRAVLLDLYDHVRSRLLQVASPMICISAGIGLTSSAHYVRTGSGHGLALAALLVVLTMYIAMACLLTALLDPRADWPGARGKPWAFPLATVGLSIAGMLFLIYAIPAQHRQDAAAATAHACDQAGRPDRR